MLKIKSLNKFISVGILSVLMFVFSFGMAFAQPVLDSNAPNLETEQVADFDKTSLNTAIVNIVNYFIGLVSIMAVVMIVYAGYVYITSGGDEKNTAKAKNMLLYAVIGIVVAILAYSVVTFAKSFLGITT